MPRDDESRQQMLNKIQVERDALIALIRNHTHDEQGFVIDLDTMINNAINNSKSEITETITTPLQTQMNQLANSKANKTSDNKDLSDVYLELTGALNNKADKFVLEEEEEEEVQQTAFLTGMIMMWAGNTTNVPEGWALCDGNNSTPDLRDKFIIGAGGTKAPNTFNDIATSSGNVGDTALTVAQMPSHNHSIGGSVPVGVNVNYGSSSKTYLHTMYDADSGANVMYYQQLSQSISGSIGNNGSGQTHTHTLDSLQVTPAYYALCFIMKV